MSLTERDYRIGRRAEAEFVHRLSGLGPVTPEALAWMKENGKEYSERTLALADVQVGLLQGYDRRSSSSRGLGLKGLVFSDPCIAIPAGPVTRCYLWKRPKPDRWRVVPAGRGAQWLGDLSGPEVLLTEGEWDWLRATDQGFDQAITHTAGSLTWLRRWTPLFARKTVWICYDRDSIGRRGALKVARELYGTARQVRIVDLPLPGTPEAKDLSDFFRLGGTVEDFEALLRGSWRYDRPIFYRAR